MNTLDKIIRYANIAFVSIAGLLIVVIAILTCLNIVFRLIGSPISGTVELVGFFGAVSATFALAYTQLKKDHICVTVLVDKFPIKFKRFLGFTNDIVCMLFSAVATVQIFKLGNIILKTGEVTETLRIAFYPFIYAAAAGFALLVVVFLGELIKFTVEGIVNEPSVFEKEFEQQGDQ